MYVLIAPVPPHTPPVPPLATFQRCQLSLFAPILRRFYYLIFDPLHAFGAFIPAHPSPFDNRFWFAATAKGQTTVTIFDIRKEGDAAKVKVLEVGGTVQDLAWDYSQQFLATAGPAGITVQQYTKGNKRWSGAKKYCS